MPPKDVEEAGLHYVEDSVPGYRRRRQGKRFIYLDCEGERLRDPREIARIDALAIPPAYRRVWICSDPLGHLQATGFDARGRKQYRYHPRWRELRDTHKYHRMLAFAEALPRLRARVEADLARPGLGREKVVATVVALLDQTLIRVGNDRYARDNRSFGLTTLRTRHVALHGSSIRFRFRGKSGVEQSVSLRHRRLASTLRRCLELPGQQLFQYLDDDGKRHSIDSSDVNAYLQTHGGDFSAKDYRTWGGSVLALQRLVQCTWQPQTQARREVADTLKAVARQLGNTPAVCRKCYVHPRIFECFACGALAQLPKARARKWLDREEVALLRFLQQAESQLQDELRESA